MDLSKAFYCVKSVGIRSFSGPYFPAFGLNLERFGVSLHIQSETGKIRTRKTPNTDTFYAVFDTINHILLLAELDVYCFSTTSLKSM